MNKTKIRELAVAILNGDLAKRKKNPIGFNLSPFYSTNMARFYPDRTGNDCGTVACIAGWAHFLNGGKSTQSHHIASHAAKVLRLKEDDASELFAPQCVSRSEVTPQQAAVVLFNLAETGEVNWNLACII